MRPLEIKHIAVDPICYGPLDYRLIWSCAGCGSDQIVGIRGTLLLEGAVACPGCGTQYHYCYQPRTLQPDAATLAYTDRTQRALQDLLGADEDLAILGINAMFACTAHLSNEFRGIHG